MLRGWVGDRQGDGTREAITVRGQCRAKERLCGRDAAVLTQDEGDRLIILIDRAMQVVLFTTDADVGLIRHDPRRLYRFHRFLNSGTKRVTHRRMVE